MPVPAMASVPNTTPGTAPDRLAVLNAVFAATGKPMRSLPLKNVKLV